MAFLQNMGIIALLFLLVSCAEGQNDETSTDSHLFFDTSDTQTSLDTGSGVSTESMTEGDTETTLDTPALDSADTADTTIPFDSDADAWFIDTAPPFEDDVIHTFHVTMTQENLDWLNDNATLEEYVPAMLTFDETPMGEVGVRYKGASSLHYCFDEEGNRIETNKCAKLSVKIRFDKYAENTRLYGLKRINLHAMQADYSKLKERMAYKLFRTMDVPAPRSGHARLMLNGEFMGLFALVEQVDGRFTANRWPDAGDGNLYKENWWTKTSESEWREHLKTNGEDADVSEAVAIAAAIQNASVESFKSDVAPLLDMDHFIRYMVVDRAITNVDGITRFYEEQEFTAFNGGHTKNFYTYQLEAGGQFLLIPWDMDLTLNYPDDFMDVAGVPDWNIIPADCTQNYMVWSGNSYTKPPGCDHFHAMVVQNYWDAYVTEGEKFLNSSFQLPYMEADLDRWEAQIAPIIAEDTRITANDWDWGVNKLRNDLPLLIERFTNFLDAGLTVETSE